MDFQRENPDCKFSIVDRPTVRQQMEYLSLAGGAMGRNMLVRYWEGAKALIIPASWECKLIPKLDELDIDKENSPDIVTLLTWAGLQVRNHVNSLDEVPKN